MKAKLAKGSIGRRRRDLAGVCAGLVQAIVIMAGTAQAAEPSATLRADWPATDFSRSSVDFTEILSGGVPRDGIPALTDPAMIRVAEADLLGPEPVMTLELDGVEVRAYPLRYLTWHEIANDVVAGRPVAVTFCPLCNSGLVFDRRVGGRTLEFGVSGLLRNSDMIMYDRKTHIWWQQFTGEAIVGALTGAALEPVVTWMEGWADFAARNPEGLVMAEPTGWRRAYGRNPYVGYDSGRQLFLYTGEVPPHGIEPLARVVRVGDRAWPLERLAEAGAVEEAGLRILWTAGMGSALDTAEIAAGRDVGAIRVQDAATGQDVAHEVVFAFAFHAFEPDGIWMLGD